MADQQETIRLSHLDTGYCVRNDSVAVTKDINASLYSGELTCLLGPNGAGKSTLLKTLTGFIAPLRGEIMIGSKALTEYSDSELAKVISVVLTERLSVSNMTVGELVGMGRSPYTGFWGRMDRRDREVVDEAIALVGIEALRGRMVQTLSDGERQKVLIAKSLAQETPVIFLDEPTAFLDYPSKVEVMQLLQNLSREKDKTIFLSTHDLELALQIADKIWLLDKPHGVSIGTPEDLSLNGDMGRYFQRDGVVFDIESGLFRINHRISGTVGLTGCQPYVNMVRKALSRQGLAVTDDCSPDVIIRADAAGYSINDEICHKSVGELLDALKRLSDGSQKC